MSFIQFGTDKKILEAVVNLAERVARLEQEADFILGQPATKEILGKIQEVLELVKGIKLPPIG